MKKIVLFLAILSTILISCGSPKVKIDTEFDRIKKEKVMEDDNIVVSNETTTPPLIYDTDKNVSKPSEWNTFNSGEQKKIKTNEHKIQQLKKNTVLKPKGKRKLTSLEKENTRIKKQMAAYDHELKPNWKNFKKKMDEKLNRINKDLSQLALADKN